eukprot:scaffold75562_cov33-Tisochrysis_lutea.AAC.4
MAAYEVRSAPIHPNLSPTITGQFCSWPGFLQRSSSQVPFTPQLHARCWHRSKPCSDASGGMPPCEQDDSAASHRLALDRLKHDVARRRPTVPVHAFGIFRKSGRVATPCYVFVLPCWLAFTPKIAIDDC